MQKLKREENCLRAGEKLNDEACFKGFKSELDYEEGFYFVRGLI